jgi:hypothetical protein
LPDSINTVDLTNKPFGFAFNCDSLLRGMLPYLFSLMFFD